MTKNMTPGLRARLSLQLLFPVAFADAARVEPPALPCSADSRSSHSPHTTPSAFCFMAGNPDSSKYRITEGSGLDAPGTINTLVRINLKMKALHRPSLCFTNLTALQLVCQRSSRKITDRDRIPHKTYFRNKQKLLYLSVFYYLFSHRRCCCIFAITAPFTVPI